MLDFSYIKLGFLIYSFYMMYICKMSKKTLQVLLVGIWNVLMILELIPSDTQNTKWGNSQNLWIFMYGTLQICTEGSNQKKDGILLS